MTPKVKKLYIDYEIIMGGTMDHKSFRRRILGADILEETGKMKDTVRGSAMMYRRNENTHLFVSNIESAQMKWYVPWANLKHGPTFRGKFNRTEQTTPYFLCEVSKIPRRRTLPEC